ncbi:MAG: preprotein translocase subunit SecG [Endozoicomonas sp. (ex Botrylloides leachii)]|nr:preprotein translocase subunit SecG [Endozoicomonas sp. (ex Botrylloides leachii)]
METIILVIHVLVAVAVIGMILIQQGKGAETGASFGSGASQTVFGSQGSANFLSRFTAVLATVFFLTSFGLAIMARHKADAAANVGIPAAVTEKHSNSDAPVPTEKYKENTNSTISNDAPVVGSKSAKDTDAEPAAAKGSTGAAGKDTKSAADKSTKVKDAP